MYCRTCGRQQQEGELFCPICGTKYELDETPQEEVATEENVDVQCPMCDTPLGETDYLCPNCQRSLYYTCGNCQSNYTYYDLIRHQGCCPICGGRVTELGNIPNYKYPYFAKVDKKPAEKDKNKSTVALICIPIAILLLALLGFGFYKYNTQSNYNTTATVIDSVSDTVAAATLTTSSEKYGSSTTTSSKRKKHHRRHHRRHHSSSDSYYSTSPAW